MYEWLKRLVLRVTRVPPEPEPPLGSPGSLTVFRAAENYLRYRRYVWLFSQGLVALSFLAALAPTGFVVLERGETTAQLVAVVTEFVLLLVYLVQAVVTYITIKLDYEMRWYMVTDRSLRIREGVWHVREMTLTFANIQNLSISQGPVQRIFRIADLKVQTAGGGGGAASTQGVQHSMHVGFFRGIDDAERVRDLMLERLRRIKDSGLGDADDAKTMAEAPRTERGTALAPSLVVELRALHEEARALRAVAERLAG